MGEVVGRGVDATVGTTVGDGDGKSEGEAVGEEDIIGAGSVLGIRLGVELG